MGTTSSGKQRWRCTHCGHTFTNPNSDKTNAYRFAIFIDWITGQRPLDAVATDHNVSRRTLIRWFTYFWFIIVPCKPDPHRVYDQLFIDGTYFHKNACLSLQPATTSSPGTGAHEKPPTTTPNSST